MPDTLQVIMVIGGCTALLAALIALTQNDIKKVLAYSTVSQLGYMFFAVGMGAYSAALFHVVTHAFFKALLFLGSGAVILAVHHEQDMRKMGGLRRSLPWTHLMFLVGTAAIAGAPLMSGFISKDEILFTATQNGHWMWWGVTYVTAGLTAFYMVRLLLMTFYGESRVDPKVADHVQEPGFAISGVLGALALGSIMGGAMNWPHFLGGHPWVTAFTGLPDGMPRLPEGSELAGHPFLFAALSVGVGLVGMAFAIFFILKGGREPLRSFTASGLGAKLHRLSSDKFYVDEFFGFFVAFYHNVSGMLYRVVDVILIQNVLVKGVAQAVRGLGQLFAQLQTGFATAYLLTFSCGAVALIFIVLKMLKPIG